MKLAQSDVVRVRRSRWQIADIRAYDGCEVISLRGLGPDNTGVERRVLTPFDRVMPILDSLPKIGFYGRRVPTLGRCRNRRRPDRTAVPPATTCRRARVHERRD